MGRCCFNKITLVLFCALGLSCVAEARCLLADKYYAEGRERLALAALDTCAIQYNDDESQIKLADSYVGGKNGLPKDEKAALYMYQLSAENGNAEAQVKLAELLQTFDTSSERRKELKKYQEKLQRVNADPNTFSGEIQHPYTLLLLAVERPENKWYYPSVTRAAPARAAGLLRIIDCWII